MANKYLILTVLTALACTGCMDKSEGPAVNKAVQIGDIEPYVDYQIPVKSGMATIVTLGEDTLAVTRTTATVPVPRQAAQAGEIKTTYSNDPIYENFASSQHWHYIAFEDSRKADYDYNDLVIHGRVRTSNAGFGEDHKLLQKHEVLVQPVALGGTRKMKLGILYKESEESDKVLETILCEDVRAALFGNDPRFPINTDPSKEIKQVNSTLIPFFTFTNYDLGFKVVWFIETETDRFYAATTNFGADKTYDMISPDGLPYGISLTKKWDYPIEKCSIRDVYPGFDEWLRTGDENVLLKDPVREKKFPASYCKLWDYTN